VNDPEELKRYVINIYKTLLTRGILGTYVFVCGDELRMYLSNRPKKTKEVGSNSSSKPIPITSPYNSEITFADSPLYDSIGCGELMYAESTIDEDVQAPSWLIKPDAKYFALHTKGDSMYQLGIEDGDIILCQKNYQAPSGSNAVVLVGDEATLKQIMIEKDGLVLIPKSTNSEHKVRKLTEEDEFKVLGVYVCKL
jgi:SOS-response transcriptional repressor LexA